MGRCKVITLLTLPPFRFRIRGPRAPVRLCTLATCCCSTLLKLSSGSDPRLQHVRLCSAFDRQTTNSRQSAFRPDRLLDRKVLLKLDLLLMPVMRTIFVLLFLDRANIGNAGLQKDLRLTSNQYQIGVHHFLLCCICNHSN